MAMLNRGSIHSQSASFTGESDLIKQYYFHKLDIYMCKTAWAGLATSFSLKFFLV